MTSAQIDWIVIDAGPAGVLAALRAGYLGVRTVLVASLVHVPLAFPTYAGILAYVAAGAARQLGLEVSWQAHQLEST
jgi:succinate dehydrogenase/fumarate reductase flavoprotein subunit